MNATTNTASYSSWLNSDKDISTSPFGRQLSFSGKCARFSTIDRTSTAAKVVAWTIQAVAVAILASPIILLGTNCVYVASVIVSVPLTFGGVVFLVSLTALSVILSQGHWEAFFEPILNERGVQIEEQQIIDALGGKEEFDKLPRFTKEQIDELPDYDILKLSGKGLKYIGISGVSDVNAPITVGIDLHSRPFISFRLTSKTETQDQETFVDTYVSKFSPVRSNSWTLRSQYKYFEDPRSFSLDVGQCSETIRQLKMGTHPTLKLV